MKEKVNVTGVPETMVQTLYARAKETRKKNAKINDEIAVELVKKLDYDFSKADKDSAMTYGVIARTIVLDRMVEQYLEKHANTVVVNIACGLYTRCYRMEGKYLPLKETIRGFKEILDGKHDEIPEQMFLFAGGIDEVVEKFEKSRK